MERTRGERSYFICQTDRNVKPSGGGEEKKRCRDGLKFEISAMLD